VGLKFIKYRLFFLESHKKHVDEEVLK